MNYPSVNGMDKDLIRAIQLWISLDLSELVWIGLNWSELVWITLPSTKSLTLIMILLYSEYFVRWSISRTSYMRPRRLLSRMLTTSRWLIIWFLIVDMFGCAHHPTVIYFAHTPPRLFFYVRSVLVWGTAMPSASRAASRFRPRGRGLLCCDLRDLFPLWILLDIIWQ